MSFHLFLRAGLLALLMTGCMGQQYYVQSVDYCDPSNCSGKMEKLTISPRILQPKMPVEATVAISKEADISEQATWQFALIKDGTEITTGHARVDADEKFEFNSLLVRNIKHELPIKGNNAALTLTAEFAELPPGVWELRTQLADRISGYFVDVGFVVDSSKYPRREFVCTNECNHSICDGVLQAWDINVTTIVWRTAGEIRLKIANEREMRAEAFWNVRLLRYGRMMVAERMYVMHDSKMAVEGFLLEKPRIDYPVPPGVHDHMFSFQFDSVPEGEWELEIILLGDYGEFLSHIKFRLGDAYIEDSQELQ